MAEFFENPKSWRCYRPFLDNLQPTLAIDVALAQLEAVKLDSECQFELEHKGTPYYLMGYAAFISHDYVGASTFFDAALAQDYKAHYKNGVLDTSYTGASAPLFMMLDDSKEDRLASPIIQEIVKSLEEIILYYNGLEKADAEEVSVDWIRDIFLRKIIINKNPDERTLITTFISFIAEWKYRSRLINVIQHGSPEPFYLHLFRGGLLLESLIKEGDQNKTPGTLEQAIKKLLGCKLDIRCNDLKTLLKKELECKNIKDSCQIAGEIRNAVGHKISRNADLMDKIKYDLLVKNIAAACIYAIKKGTWN